MASNNSGILIDGQLFRFDGSSANLPAELRQGLLRWLMNPPPVRHAEATMLFSLDDEPARPSQRLFDLAAKLATESPKAAHPILSRRPGGETRWFETFPGEHYHLLTTLCRVMNPKIVWEFGTDTGMGTVAMLEGLSDDARLFTVDIDPIATKSGAWLESEDFATGRVNQIISDMKSPQLFTKYAQQLAEADLLFVDGPKDGFTEEAFIEQLDKVKFHRPPIVMFDDIRLMNMLTTWRKIAHPKMDFTSFGHWSGTGLVDWTKD